MALSKEEVLHVAKLARLEFSPEEIEKYQQELNDILNYIDTVSYTHLTLPTKLEV